MKKIQESKDLYMRFAEPQDLKDLYLWRNDESTRKASFSTEEITIEEHTKWFKESLANVKRNIFIICDKECKKLGQIRFDKINDSAEIYISIKPEYRNQGIGSIALYKSSNIYFNNFPVKKIIAKVKKWNKASLKAFEKAGYTVNKEHIDYIELWYEK